MHIDSYQFGKIVVDGTSYTSDVIILGKTIVSNWWRKQGHLLSAEDLEAVFAAAMSFFYLTRADIVSIMEKQSYSDFVRIS